MSSITRLESRIDYQFSDDDLIVRALTHRSFSDNNNERLEFLGDSILNFVIASALFEQFEGISEGDLSRLRASQVKQETLASVARDIDLGSFLRMGSGELKSGGFERDSILSDALEAIIGAVYLDAGMEEATRLVLSLFGERLDSLSEEDSVKDAKSRLQEFLQAAGDSLPEYVLLKTIGKSPNQVFEVECRSSRFEAPVRARGASRRKAEQRAATRALQHLGMAN